MAKLVDPEPGGERTWVASHSQSDPVKCHTSTLLASVEHTDQSTSSRFVIWSDIRESERLPMDQDGESIRSNGQENVKIRGDVNICYLKEIQRAYLGHKQQVLSIQRFNIQKQTKSKQRQISYIKIYILEWLLISGGRYIRDGYSIIYLHSQLSGQIVCK